MHELKDHREASRGLIKQFIFQKYDVWMRRQLSKGLNFLQAVDLKKRKSLGSNTRGSKRVWIWELLSHLMQGRKEAFHTFHCVVESIFNILNFHNFAERSFSFLWDQLVFFSSITIHFDWENILSDYIQEEWKGTFEYNVVHCPSWRERGPISECKSWLKNYRFKVKIGNGENCMRYEILKT